MNPLLVRVLHGLGAIIIFLSATTKGQGQSSLMTEEALRVEFAKRYDALERIAAVALESSNAPLHQSKEFAAMVQLGVSAVPLMVERAEKCQVKVNQEVPGVIPAWLTH